MLSLNTHRIFKRLAKALIRLCICAGWSEALLVRHTTLFEISCHGSIIFFRGVGRSLTLLILGMPVCPWWRQRTICKLWKRVVERERERRERERERERETSACTRISFNLKNIMYRCWKRYLEMLLVRIGFCTTKSDIRQYWCFACFLSHAQMFKLTKHSNLKSIRIWSGSELWQRF